MKNFKKKDGITLIALVVTIVVLLILAGVSINLVIGNNGLITKAQEAKEKTQQAAENDVSDMESLAEFVNTEAGSNTSSIPDTGNTDADNLISFSIDGIPYKAEKGMMLYDFYRSNYYTANPLPETKNCSGCGASMTLSLFGGVFSSTNTLYEGSSACYSKLSVPLDHVIENGDIYSFSSNYCDD